MKLRETYFALALAAGAFFLTRCGNPPDAFVASPRASFIDLQLKDVRKELKAKFDNNQKLFGPAYAKAVQYDQVCDSVIAGILVAKSTPEIKDQLRKLQQQSNLVLNNEPIATNVITSLDDLYGAAGTIPKDQLVSEIKLMDYGYWVFFNEAGTKNDFSLDYVEVRTTNDKGVAGQAFETEIMPAGSSSTKLSMVITGEQFDDEKNLLGKTDTLASSPFPHFRVANPSKGVHDVPAIMLVPNAKGDYARIPFTIHYEIR